MAMPARAHVIIVARAGRSASSRLSRTLDALSAQSAPTGAVTVVVLGDAASIRGLGGIGRTVEGIIEARPGTTFSEAVALARPRVPAGTPVWLLTDGAVPDPEALALLSGALERSPSAAIAAPKLVRRDDDREIVSMGVSMTRWGRAVELAAGELDQGQHDDLEDVLGADVRGMLIRAEAPLVLRPDIALADADEGLDLGVRARLGGARLVVVPRARVGVDPGAEPARGRATMARAWAARRSQLHRRLAYAPAIAVPLHWLSLLPLALWRSITHLIGKRPGNVAPEWGAALTAMVRLRALARSRRAIRSFRRASWAEIAPLRVSRTQLRQRLDDGHGTERGATSELNFFGGGGAWAVLAALVIGLAAFVAMLAWPAIGGGALLPLRRTVGALWADAAWGLRDVGLGVIGPADPFAGVLAVLGTLSPAAPSFALVMLWLTALPLAVLGGWFAATRVTDRAGLRILGGVLWALAPTFLTALMQGRPAAVLVHLLLPWVLHSAAVAHRSWGAAGAASVLTAATLACAPSLAPAFAALWLITLVLMLAGRRLRGAARVFWLLIPSAALFAPLVVRRIRDGEPWALLADPGVLLALDPAARTDIATGFPSGDRSGWGWFADGVLAPWAPLLLAPVALLALLSALSPRWRAGCVLLVTSLAGLSTALFMAGIVVAFTGGTGVAVWPGTGLSLAWLGAVGAALVALDTVVVLTPLRTGAALLAGVTVAVCAVPALLSLHQGRALVQNGPTSTLPALVAAQPDDGDGHGTLVLTPLNDGSLSARIIWGSSDTLGARSTLMSTATAPLGEDIAPVAVDMISGRDFDAAASLADDGISFVLLATTPQEQDRARALRDQATTAIDQRTGLVKAGDTARGMLWRIDGDIAPRAQLTAGQHAVLTLISAVQLIVLLAALLLAIPTRASRRASRSRSRIVGRMPDEPIVLPRRRIADHQDPQAPPVTAHQPAHDDDEAETEVSR
ncbi:glycosyltransferase [Microbacterium sp. ARD32]|uniref:glycosyltransferase n=1 Tax=Microbacterium sp. ARD32 TaxID=2962577 RepID=UPI002881ED45|nr:glycosyltransferase [Microbacterium sp. ARD32]MDT0156774.1 glycosyltransferase [Microbacterium sp. ARD32]